MPRLRTIARRGFLIGSVAIAGGVAFGVYAARQPHDNPLARDLAAGEASFNPWVRISTDGITLITPHGDMGQGVAHMQALLIAEEMDLELDQFDIDFGPPSAAYYNRGFTVEGADTMAALLPLSEDMLAASLAPALKLAGLQVTGGSSSAIDSFDKLREAGAVARETLKAAAAAEFGADPARIRTRAGTVILPDGREVAYTYLAAAAATLEPARDVALRDPADWRLIGKPTQRLDMVAKSTGTLPFGIDVTLDGMVHAALRTNPRRTALQSYDADAARTMRGVIDVVEVTGGIAVVADNTWRAFQAVDAIDCTWGQADYPAEQSGHWQVLTDALDAGGGLTWRDDGDAGTQTTGAQHVTAEYRAPYVGHQPLEPLNAVIRVTDTGAEVWTGHQVPQLVRNRVAGITGHDRDDVIFHNQFMGGSFGHRLEVEFVGQCAEIANRMRGRPVKLTYSREQDFATDFPRQIAMARGAGSGRNGKITHLDLTIASAAPLLSQSGRAGLPAAGPDLQIAAGAWGAPYDVDNFRVRAITVAGLAPTSSWRSVGASTAGFFIESLVDEAIHAAGGDPMAERIRLCADPVARACLEAVAEMSDWDRDPGADRGRGVALVTSFGVPVAEVVEVTSTNRGIRIDKVFVAADVGRVVDPVNFENNAQGGVIWGLGHAMHCAITYSDGMAQQDNYHTHAGMRLRQCPQITVKGLENRPEIRGIGEPPVPPAAPALANAIFAATGQRLREMPFDRFVDFA